MGLIYETFRRYGGYLAVALAACALSACSAKSPEELLAEAHQSIERKDFSAASIQLKNALQKNPEFALARLELGRVSLEQRDYLSAEKELNKALEFGVSADDAVPLLARALIELGRAQDVNSRFSALRLSNPAAQASLNTSLGFARLAANDTDGANRLFDASLAASPGDPRALVGKARVLAVGKNFDAASDLIKPLLQADGGSVEAWLLEAEIRSARNDREGMLQALREVYRIRPNHLSARTTVVSALVGQKRFDEARTELNELKKVAPSALEAEYLTGLLLTSEGKFVEARTSIDKVLAKAPDYLPAVWLAATVNYQLKSYAQAEQHAEKLVSKGAGSVPVRKILIGSYLGTGRVAKSKQALEPLLRDNPDNPEVLALAGQVQLAGGDSDAALKSFEKSARMRPDDADAQSRLGLVKLATGDYRGGISALQSASRLDDDTRPDLLIVLAHLRERNADAALAALDTIDKKKPGDPVLQNLRGAAHLLKGNKAAARTSFEAALKIQPGFFPAASNLARLDSAEGKPDEGIKRFEAVLSHDPNHADALMALAGLRAQRREGWPEAERLLERAVKSHPGLLQSRAAQVQFYSLTGDRPKALRSAQAAVTENPDSAAMLDLLAEVQSSQGDSSAAVATRVKATEKTPNDAAVWVKLAVAQLAVDKPSEAEKNLKRALQLKPDAPEVEVLLAGLYRSQRSFDEAFRIARSLQKRYPKGAAGYLVEGDVMLAASRMPDAVSAFREAYSREPSAQVLIRLLSVLDLDGQEAASRKLGAEWRQKHPQDVAVVMYEAGAAMNRGQYDRARADYLQVLKQTPENVIALNNMAWMLWKAKDAEARSFAERAHRLAPDNPAVLDTYGVILVDSGKSVEGVNILRKAVEKAPQSDAIRLNFARALVQNNQKAEARPHLEKLVALGRKFAGSDEAATLLKSL